METANSLKKTLRQKILQKRDSLSQREVIEKSVLIMQAFTSSTTYRKAKTILFYFPKGKEVNTEPMLRHAMKTGKTVALPVTDPATKTLQLYVVADPDADLTIGAYGIKEPLPKK